MIHSYTDAEIDITSEGLSDPSKLKIFTDYWFDKGDGFSFTFDRGFEEEYKWQHKLVYARQPLIVAIAGIGTGKTLGVGMAATTWAISTEGFKFMNGANWAYQAKLMYELIVQQITDTPAERLLEKCIESPYPKITFKYKVDGSTYTSSLEFMSMDKNAQKIFSWRGDWINLDEAALIGDLDIAMMNLSTRLTGNTPRGREFLGRMSLMSNPWDNDSSGQLYYFYDMAIDQPDECLSITLPTRGNKNISDRQVGNAMKFIPKDEQSRMLDGERPEGKGLYFSRNSVSQCIDQYASLLVDEMVKRGDPRYSAIRVPTIGVVQFEQPSNSNSLMLIGDPGTGSFPARNAPVIALFDTALLPDGPARLISFWWGNGNGRIQPFIDKLYEWKNKYRPFFTGVDSTGPQAGLVEMMNVTHYVDGETASPMNSLVGLDFSGNKKYQYLIALRILLESKLFTWPDFCKGIRSQLINYDPAKDKAGLPKIAQDIVSVFSMAAYIIRVYYRIEASHNDQDGNANIILSNLAERYRRDFTRDRSERPSSR